MYRYEHLSENTYQTSLYKTDTFTLTAIVNQRHFLSGVSMCGYPQSTIGVHSDMKLWVSKFTNDLQKVYGQPVYKRMWDKKFTVKSGETVLIYKFKKNSVELTMDIIENNGLYYIYMEIIDLKFYDGEKI
jgi:hypothetical protein